MTDDELDRMERLWREGMSSKGIASVMGYERQTILAVASRHRERFPYRYKPVDTERMAEWVGRCLRGEATQLQAARALGVSETTVWQHVRKAREREPA